LTLEVICFGSPPHLVRGQPTVLMPGRLYLGHTEEIIGSYDYVTTLIGKSSMGRLGLYLQISADLGHQGAIHRWTLELCVVQPIRVYAGMVIGQVSFWKTHGKPNRYKGVYAKADRPLESQSMRQM
jgi:dCTP deaminase